MCSIVFVCVLAVASFAQSTTSRGSLEGTIKDSKGGVVPGATVSVHGIDTGFDQTVTSNSDGIYRIETLPVGNYKVTIGAVSGFAETSVNATVVLGKQTTADVTLGISAAVNTVEVTSDPLGVVVDSTASQVQTDITSNLINRIPAGTSFSSVLKLSPETRSDQLTGGFTVDGASKAENTFSIDGQDVTNFRHGTLGDNGGIDNQSNVPTALIKEVQVKTSGFDAEYGGASGGVISVITKSGSDQFHGEAGAQFTTSRWQPNPNSSPSQNTYDQGSATQALFALPPPAKDDYLEYDPTATLSGPIIKKHLWFFGIYSPQHYNASRVVHYYTINPTTGVLSVDPRAGSGASGAPVGPTES